MSRKIFKYQIGIDTNILDMPKGSKVLSVHSQYGKVVLYAEVDDTQVLTKRKYIIYGTGHEFVHNDEYDYVGTVITHNDALVWHIYISKES